MISVDCFDIRMPQRSNRKAYREKRSSIGLVFIACVCINPGIEKQHFHTTRLLPQGNWFTMGKFAWIHLWLICLGFNPIKTTLVTGVGVNNLQDTNNSKTFLACKSNHTHACNSMTSYIFYLSQFNLLLIFFNKHSDQELFFYNVWLSACTTRTISDIPCQQYCHLFLDCLVQVFVYDSFISWGWFLGLIFRS